MHVTLEAVDASNIEAARAIRVTEAQRAFIDPPSVAEFFVDDAEHPTFASHLVRDGDAAVGFVSYGHEPDEHDRWWIPLLVVDASMQRRGYGRAALEAVTSRIAVLAPQCREVGLACRPDNEAAMRLYLGMGFEQRGAPDATGSVQLWLRLPDAR